VLVRGWGDFVVLSLPAFEIGMGGNRLISYS
jgi:hypothetical protein